MIMQLVKKWEENKEKFKEYLSNAKDAKEWDYLDLLKALMIHITPNEMYDLDAITEVNDSSNNGSIIYLIPENTYAPQPCNYLVTYVFYGSCSTCDVNQEIKSWGDFNSTKLNNSQVNGYMNLALHMLQKMKYLYNDDEVTYNQVDDEFED